MGSSLGPQGRWALGMSFVMTVAVIWVVASFVVQAVEATGTTPFLLTYICNSLFVLYIPLTELTRLCQSQFQKRWAKKELQLPASPQGGGKKGNWHFELWRRQSLPASYAAVAKSDEVASLERGDGEDEVETLPPPPESSDTNKPGKPHRPLRIETSWVPHTNPPGASQTDQPPLHNHLVSPSQVLGGRAGLASPRSPITPSGGGGFRAMDFSPQGPFGESRHSLTLSHRPPVLPSTPEQGPWIDTGVGVPFEGQRLPHAVLRTTSDVLSEDDGGGYSEVDMSEHLWHPGMQQPQGGGYCEEHKRAARIGLIIAPLWFMGQYTFNLSLILTSVTSNTILSSCSSLFTFFISVIWLKEPFTFFKLAMIACVMGGTALVSIADSSPAPKGDGPSNPALGDALVLISALFYATYTTFLRKELPEEKSEEELGEAVQGEEVSTALVFGFVGLFGALLLWPILLGLHLTGVEKVHKLTGRQFGLIVGKGLLDNVLSDYLWARAVVLTTPTAATVGLAFQTPVAIVADIFVNGNSPSLMLLLGGFLVTLGFFGINVTPLTSCAEKLDGSTPERGGLEMSPDHRPPPDALRTS